MIQKNRIKTLKSNIFLLYLYIYICNFDEYFLSRDNKNYPI